ncbi:uncharacterized protein LOC132341482 [Haemorhous mexicanus]|uniref:uncharacterized protein LOC132341482 n=1 Tax=Haemorhous mexicanus TaxID=30427 RepID=UPI0028BF235B|nr:uncharacterized protein LOC132341482 [Haemorhous mexicanus]
MEKLKGILGSNASIPQTSPLGCLLAHWKQGNFGEELRQAKLIDYCNTWWPEYILENGKKWPKYGTLQYGTISQLMSFCKKEGKWDEVPYVDLFFYLREKPEWQDECGLMVVRASASNKCAVCEERCLKHLALKESLSRENYADIDLQVAPIRPREPSPTPPVSSVPIPLPFHTSPNPEPVSSSTPFPLFSPLPSSPDPFSSEDEQNLTVIERRGRDASERNSNGNKSVTPVAHRTRSRSELAPVVERKDVGRQKRTVIAPLRQGVGAEGPVYVKVPFSPADLIIWKQSAGTYRENPDKVERVVKMIMKTQNPDWDDIQVILDTLMDSTEKEMGLKAAKERAREDIRNGLVTGNLDLNFPNEDQKWNPNLLCDMRRLQKYQEVIQIGVQNAVPKTINWSKQYEVWQEKKESPTAFLERLKEAARKYTDLQIDTEQAKVQLALIFLGQSQDDIRKKSQKLEGEELRNLD